MGKRLRDGFAAGVKTTDTNVVVTVGGAVQLPVEVYVPAGGELPDNLAEGEEARLDALGAFTPVLPYAERVRLQGAALKDSFDEDAFVVPQSYPPSLAHGTAAVGDEVTTPGLAVDELPAPLPDDDSVAGPLPEGTSDVHGNVSPDIAHGTPPEGEFVQGPVEPHEVGVVVQEQMAEDAGTTEKTVVQHAKAKRASTKKSE